MTRPPSLPRFGVNAEVLHHPGLGRSIDSGYDFVDGRRYADNNMKETRGKLVTQLIAEAAGSPRRLATRSQTYVDAHGESQVVYGLVQCSTDLSLSECTNCLENMAQASLGANATVANNRRYGCYITYTTDPIDVQSAGPSNVQLSIFTDVTRKKK